MLAYFFFEFLQLHPQRVYTLVDSLLKSVAGLGHVKWASTGHGHRDTGFLIESSSGLDNF